MSSAENTTLIKTENRLFPIFLKLEQSHVLILGGDNNALKTLSELLHSSPETKITLVARKIIPEIFDLQKRFKQLTLHTKTFTLSDLDTSDIVFASIGDRTISENIYNEATKRNLLINVSDAPDLSNFQLGAVFQKENLTLAVSGNGKSKTFTEQLKDILDPKKEKEKRIFYKRVLLMALYSLSVLALMLVGHLFFTLIPLTTIGGYFSGLATSLDANVFLYIFCGFTAQMIDGALGMAYGVSVTTFLMSLGIPSITPAVASASMHASEIFTTGTSSLVYMRYKNVNNKLFQTLLIPGALGAIAGAFTISYISKDYVNIVKPIVAFYTLSLGILIIRKALNLHIKNRRRIKKIKPVAAIGGFLDSVGGGGWGPIVTTTLIAGGRNMRYAIGSSHVAKFFVALISTITFIIVIGLHHWQVIFGLVIGSMVAAPLSIYLSFKISNKWGLILVGFLVIILSLRTIVFTFIH